MDCLGHLLNTAAKTTYTFLLIRRFHPIFRLELRFCSSGKQREVICCFFFLQIKSLRLKPHTHDDRGSSPAWITCFVHANNNQKPDYRRTASGTKTSRGQERLQASLLAKWFPPKNDWKFCLRVCSSGAQRDCDSFSNIEAISWKRVKKSSFKTFIISDFVCLIRSAHSRPEPSCSRLDYI